MKYETEVVGAELDEVRVLTVSMGSRSIELAGSFREASRKCREHIELWGLGASAWRGGLVRDEHNRPVARVSYNGRVWKA